MACARTADYPPSAATPSLRLKNRNMTSDEYKELFIYAF